MEMDEAFNPIEVTLLGGEGILLDPNSVADAVKQTRCGRRSIGSTIGPLPEDFRGVSMATR